MGEKLLREKEKYRDRDLKQIIGKEKKGQKRHEEEIRENATGREKK